MTVKLIDHRNDNEKEFPDEETATEKRNDLIALGAKPEDLEIVSNGSSDDINATFVDHTGDVKEPNDDTNAKEPEIVEPVEELSQDPISWLEGINTDFVNTIKGKPAISKQGFRFIQSRFGITTESELVQWVDEPTGCVIWAKAELPNGQSAEAHGEGYITESDVSDNEFVRYADSRAKNRAISDLTSAGALAVSEMSGDEYE